MKLVESKMLMVPHKTGHYPVQSVQDLRRALENKGILFLELEAPRQVGKTTMLNALALGYSQLKDNRVLLMTHRYSMERVDESFLHHKNIDVVPSGRIKQDPNVIMGIKYDVILIDEIHGFTITELVQKLRLGIRTNSLKVFVIVK